ARRAVDRPGTAVPGRATMRDMNVAPIGTGDLVAALRAHGESVMLPAAAYTGAEVYAWERRHVFAGGWTCLGRAGELAGAAGSGAGPAHRGSDLSAPGRRAAPWPRKRRRAGSPGDPGRGRRCPVDLLRRWPPGVRQR